MTNIKAIAVEIDGQTVTISRADADQLVSILANLLGYQLSKTVVSGIYIDGNLQGGTISGFSPLSGGPTTSVDGRGVTFT